MTEHADDIFHKLPFNDESNIYRRRGDGISFHN